jgi:hypothetical protein
MVISDQFMKDRTILNVIFVMFIRVQNHLCVIFVTRALAQKRTCLDMLKNFMKEREISNVIFVMQGLRTIQD